MTVKIFESEFTLPLYGGIMEFEGEFRSASSLVITLQTKENGVMAIPLSDIEYFEDSDVLNVITVLSRMKNFNVTGKVKIDLIPES